MKNNIYFKAFCFVLSFLFLSTNTYALSGWEQKHITEDDLKHQYPNARFYSVTREEFNAAVSAYQNAGTLIAMADSGIDVRMDGNNLAGYEILTAAQLKEKYPQADFNVTTINKLKIKKELFENSRIIIAHNETIIPVNDEQDQTIANIIEHYPDEKFAVYYLETAEAFNTLKKELDDGIIVTTSIQKPETVNNGAISSSGTPVPDIDIVGSCISDFTDVGDDAAVVLFVVIGIFVVAALVIYGGKFIYDAVTDKADHDYVWEISPAVTLFDRSRNNGVEERGSMAGVKVVTSIYDRNFQVGLACEAGRVNLRLYNDDSEDLYKVNGFYWMAGPHLSFSFNSTMTDNNPSGIMLEVLAGTTDHENAGLISAARTGVVFGINDHVRFGITIGSLYFDLDETEGIVTEDDNFRLIFGLQLGYRF